MRIIFIYSNINVRAGNFGKYPAMQLGIGSISSLLKESGHETDLFILGEDHNFDDIFNYIENFHPDIIAFTAVTTQFEYIYKTAEQIREKFPHLFQICGGHHATLVKENILTGAPFDAICIGEGEYPMLELVSKKERGEDFYRIDNLCFKKSDGRIIKNIIRPFLEDLDKLPFLDRDLFSRYIELENYPHSVLTTRGCYFNCSYCCNHYYKTIAPGKYVRSRSAENVIKEIEIIKKRFPDLDYLYIEDETIGQDREYWNQLLPYLQKTGLKFGTNYRIGVTNIDFLELLKKANFKKINIGIESGNEYIRKKVLKRNYSNRQIIDTFKKARSLGMVTKSYNLIGLPHETPEMFEDTIKINKLTQPDETMLNIFYPYPGTALDITCDELGLKPDFQKTGIRERTVSILDLPEFPAEKIMYYFNNWRKLVRGSMMQRFKRLIRRYTRM